MKLQFGEPKTPGTGGLALYDGGTVVGFFYTEENAAAMVAAVNHAEALEEALLMARSWVRRDRDTAAPEDAVYVQGALDEIDAVLAAYAAAKEAQP